MAFPFLQLLASHGAFSNGVLLGLGLQFSRAFLEKADFVSLLLQDTLHSLGWSRDDHSLYKLYTRLELEEPGKQEDWFCMACAFPERCA